MTRSVGLIGVAWEPVTSYVISSLIDAGVTIDCVIFDDTKISKKELAIWSERTNDQLPGQSFSAFDRYSIPFFYISSHESDTTAALIRDRGIDLVVNAVTPRILTGKVLSAASVGFLNVHPGILPNYRGCCAVEWSIYNDDPIGNSVHFMAEGIDEGPVFATERYDLDPTDQYVDARVKVYRNGFRFLAECTAKLSNSAILPTDLPPQVGGNYYGVIDEKRMSVVLRKLHAGTYRYQKSS